MMSIDRSRLNDDDDCFVGDRSVENSRTIGPCRRTTTDNDESVIVTSVGCSCSALTNVEQTMTNAGQLNGQFSSCSKINSSARVSNLFDYIDK
jgi:hypothetical protein